MPSLFIDKHSIEYYLQNFLKENVNAHNDQSADNLLKQAQNVLKKMKLIDTQRSTLSHDAIECAHIKALELLEIARTKYLTSGKTAEADLVNELILSQTNYKLRQRNTPT